MFKKIIIVFLLYIIYTLLFTDFTHLRKPNVEILKEQAADVKSGYNKFVDYVDDTVIPKVDTFFEYFVFICLCFLGSITVKLNAVLLCQESNNAEPI